MGTDEGITLIPARICRAVLSCTTCKTVVAVGPPVTGDEVEAVYLLGVTEGGASMVRHFGVCAGGALAFTFEQQPLPEMAKPAAARRLRIVRS